MATNGNTVYVVQVILLTLISFNEASQVITPVIGVPCNTSNVCKAKNSYCVNGVCVCDEGSFVPDVYNLRCLTTVLGDACADDTDCSMTSEASNCRDNQCLACNDSTLAGYSNCKDPYGCAYHEYDHKCWKYREIGEACNFNEQCWIYPHSNTTRVCDKFCICAPRFVYISTGEYSVDNCKLASDSAGLIITTNSWVTFLAIATTMSHLLTTTTTTS